MCQFGMGQTATLRLARIDTSGWGFSIIGSALFNCLGHLGREPPHLHAHAERRFHCLSWLFCHTLGVCVVLLYLEAFVGHASVINQPAHPGDGFDDRASVQP